jgi:3-oxoacyl-[acyl-carrier protein] reductase
VPERVALVTGAARGIGRASAAALARAGCAVAVNYASSAEEAKRTLELVHEEGSEGVVVRADVSDPGQVEAMFAEVEEALGPVTVLVNNAGVRADALAISMANETFERVLRVNLFGCFYATRRALRSMLKARYGRIVNVSSVAGLRASPGQANYSAAKAGVMALTRTVAREVAAKNITVNAVAPGPVDTDLIASLEPERYEALIAAVPAGRAATPEEVAALIVHLCSEQASFTTGGVYVIDGGMSA